MAPRKQIFRIFLFSILSCFIFVLIFYTLSNANFEAIQQDEPVYDGSSNDDDNKANELEEDEDTKPEVELEELPAIVLKQGADSNLSTRNAADFQHNLGVCRIPALEINGSEVIKFYKKFPPLDCAKGQPKPWVYIDEKRKVQPTEEAIKIGMKRIKCSWTFYDRVSDQRLAWTAEEEFVFGQKVEKGDFLKIACKTNSEEWTNAFMVVVPKKERVDQMHQNRENFGNANESMNVYILSYDSLSQMSFRRNLPKTVKFLEDEMESIVFNGYNIVGDGTPQAFIPILTGQTEEELPLTRKRYSAASYVDDVYPFIWNNFSKAGYATLYGEDGHELGTFTYRLKGFRKTPVDHFPITFFQYTEPLDRPRLCIGTEKQHIVWFRYIESFWREYKNIGLPRFSLMHHSCLSHDDINRVQQVDDDMVEHLQKMQQLGVFEDSLVIVMADHGSRFSELRQTHQGQLEERLPFFSVHFPKKSGGHKLVWENFRKNAMDRLVTPFDFHSTLMDVLRWPIAENELQSPNQLPAEKMNLNEMEKTKPPPLRSLSFFREIPLNRTCEQAGIEPHWCTCLKWQPVDPIETRKLAKTVVKLINAYTKPERAICAPLKLDKVINAKKLVPNDHLLKYSGVSDKDGFKAVLEGKVKTAFATYQILFETKPGNAKYEVTLFYDGKQITVDWTAISHINKYGDKPHCIIDKNYFMATYCVCYDKIDTD